MAGGGSVAMWGACGVWLSLGVVSMLAGCARPSALAAPVVPSVRYPLLYLDMDGTLLGSDHAIRPASLEAIEDVRACGGRVGIASGRTIEQVKPYLADVRPDIPLVLFNGAVTYDPTGTTVLRRAGLDPNSLGAVVDGLAGLDGAVLGVLAQYDDGRTLADRGGAAVAGFAAAAHVTIEATCDFTDCVVASASAGSPPPAKMLVLTEPSAVARVQADASSALSPYARAVVGNARDGVIEVLAVGTNKASAVAEVARALGLPTDAWAAIGDSQNDVELVSRGALGLAMGNCHPDTCAAADAVLEDNDTDAIAQALRERVLGPGCGR